MNMEVKVLLSLIAISCFCMVECCDRNSVNACKDDANCRIDNTYNHRKKKSIEKNRSFYALAFVADPCDFNTYDLNKDEEISKEEFYTVLGVQDESDALFAELDALTVDNAIREDEFNAISPVIISDCFISKL